MHAYNYDRATGVFIGSEPAFESPLEPGFFVLPAWATFDAPPKIPEGMQAVFVGNGVWKLQAIPEPEPVAEPPAPAVEIPGPPPVLTPEQREEMLRASLSDHLTAAQGIVAELEARRAALEA